MYSFFNIGSEPPINPIILVAVSFSKFKFTLAETLRSNSKEIEDNFLSIIERKSEIFLSLFFKISLAISCVI